MNMDDEVSDLKLSDFHLINERTNEMVEILGEPGKSYALRPGYW